MKLDLDNSWGYPVLRPDSDDYVKSDFQSNIQLVLSNENVEEITLNYSIELSVPELLALINERKARMVILVTCRDTWFTQKIDANSRGSVTLDGCKVEGLMEFLTLIVANEHLDAFTSKCWHPEYEGATFRIEANQLLAIAEPHRQFVGRELFRNFGSLIDYAVDNNVTEGTWKLDLDGDRIVIKATRLQIAHLRAGANTPQGKAALINAVFLPVFMECIHAVQGEAKGDHVEKKWAKVLEAKMSDIPGGSDKLPVELAQALLGNPLGLLSKRMKWVATNET